MALIAGHYQPLWQIVRDTVRDFLFWHNDWNMERLAEALGVHPSTMYAYTEPPEKENGSGRVIPTQRLFELAEITQDERLARYVISRFQSSGLLNDCRIGEAEVLDYKGATVEGEDFSGKDMRGLVADEKTRFIHCNFNAALLNDAQMPGTTFVECRWFRTRLLNVDMKNSTHVESDMSEANLSGADIRYSSIIDSIFRDATHNCLDARNVKFTNTQWFADRYRAGRNLEGAKLEGLTGISESHFVIGEIIHRVANGRGKFKLLAGWVWAKFLGCWQSFITILEENFSKEEQAEIYEALRLTPSWMIGVRLDFEFWKREQLLAHWGEDLTVWPERSRLRDQPLAGMRFELSNGITGVVSDVGLAKPDGLEDEDRFDTMEVTTDSMLFKGMAKRSLS